MQLFYSLVLLVFLTVNAAVSTHLMRRSLEELLTANQNDILQRGLRALDEELRRIDTLALRVLYQDSLRDILSEAGSQPGADYFVHAYADATRVRGILSSLIGPEEIPLRLSLFTADGDFVAFGRQPVDRELVNRLFLDGTASALIDEIDVLEGGRLVRSSEPDLWYGRVQEPVVSVFRELRTLREHYGYIHVQESLEKFEELLEIDLPGALFVLCDDSGREICRFPGETSGMVPGTSVRSSYTARASSSYSGWSLTLVQDSRVFLAPVRRLVLFNVLLALGLLGLGALVVILSVRHLVRPLRELHESVYRVNWENLDIHLEEKDSHRIVAQLNEGFQNMFEGLKTAVEERIAGQERESRAHFRALQNQMNPHLLHNMLSLIGDLASEEDFSGIEEVCQRLSRSLRYISKPEQEPVMLNDELGHLRDYLGLMKSHYTPLFDFSVTVDDTVPTDAAIPKLILQPIAENAFVHGFQDSRPPWRLDVLISGDEKSWTAAFLDNGCGVSSEAADSLMESLREPPEKTLEQAINQPVGGLTLKNTMARLRLLYGEDMVFSIGPDSSGTRVVIGGPCVPRFTC